MGERQTYRLGDLATERKVKTLKNHIKAARAEFIRDEGDKGDRKIPRILFCHSGPGGLSRRSSINEAGSRKRKRES